MNFLELCQRARVEARIAGTGPSSVVNQQGVLGDVVQAVQNAWGEIQMLQDSWRFLEKVIDAQLVAGTDTYIPGDFGIEDMGEMKRILRPRLTELRRIPYDEYLVKYRDSADTAVEPSLFTVSTDGAIIFWPAPEQAQSITVQYYRSPQELKLNADLPIIRKEYRDIIYWRATMDLVANESDVPVYQKAAEKYGGYLSRLENNYLPQMQVGGRRFAV